MPKRRSPDELIAELQAEIERVKVRAAERKLKKDPALRHISGAVRSIDKATAATSDKATRTALAEARATLAACLHLNGTQPSANGHAAKPRGEKPDPGRVLAYLRKNPGAKSEAICADLDTDTASLRSVLRQLRDDGKVRVEGAARATRYSAVGRGWSASSEPSEARERKGRAAIGVVCARRRQWTNAAIVPSTMDTTPMIDVTMITASLVGSMP